MRKSCNECKYCPDNLVYADFCKKEIEFFSGPGETDKRFVNIWKSNEDNMCEHYKRNFIKIIEDLFK